MYDMIASLCLAYLFYAAVTTTVCSKDMSRIDNGNKAKR